MTSHTELIERLIEWRDQCEGIMPEGEAILTEAAQALSTLTDEVARLGSLNCPHCGERALSDDEIATLTKGEGRCAAALRARTSMEGQPHDQ